MKAPTGARREVSSTLSKRRCASGKELEHPAPSPVLVLVSHVCSNSIDIMHAGDSGTNEDPFVTPLRAEKKKDGHKSEWGINGIERLENLSQS
jgi:hypothetical protein